jgi:hypothetical protein
MPAANLSTPLAFALEYARLGWCVLPLEPNAKQPLGRLVPRGMHDASTDTATIQSWWKSSPQAGIGIALAQSGLVAIDVDPRNGGAETFEQLQAAHGSLRSDVMAFTGGGGEHHVFLVPSGAALSLPGTLGPGVDLKANGYIVVEPSVHPSGKQYGWEASSSPLDGVVPSPLPDWLRSLRIELQRPAQKPNDQPVDPQQSKDVREALYLLDADNYDQWVKAGMALHSTRWGYPAYALWCGWAQQSDKFDSTDSRRKWESFHSDAERGQLGLTITWIFAEAQRAGWRNPAAKLEEAQRQPAVDPAGLVLTIEELHQRAAAVRWAVKGLVPEQGVGFMYGASQTFKSFIMLDYALHRAYGMRWMGRKTKQATPVYLAAEGGAGLMRRIEAWHQARGMDWRKCPMRVVVVALTLRTQASTLRKAIEQTGVKPGDVIVDTMSQTFTGNENSNDEVADFLRVLGAELRDGLGCTVTVVHHSGHSATERPRGASAIIANVDYAFGVFRDEKAMLAHFEVAKVKDAERTEPQVFDVTVQELGRDEDGDPITSLVAKHVNNAEALLGVHQREMHAGRGGREAVLLSLAELGMSEKSLRKAFYEALQNLDAEAKKKAFYRARDAAIAAGFLHFGFDEVDKERRITFKKEVQ